MASRSGVVVALDPGGTTGYAMAQEGHLRQGGLLRVPKHDYGELLLFLGRWVPDVVIVEDFIGGGKFWNSDFASTCKIIGVVLGWCRERRVEACVQSPMNRKAFLDDARLVNVRYKGSRHFYDALGHLLCWHYRNKFKLSMGGQMLHEILVDGEPVKRLFPVDSARLTNGE